MRYKVITAERGEIIVVDETDSIDKALRFLSSDPHEFAIHDTERGEYLAFKNGELKTIKSRNSIPEIDTINEKIGNFQGKLREIKNNPSVTRGHKPGLMELMNND